MCKILASRGFFVVSGQLWGDNESLMLIEKLIHLLYDYFDAISKLTDHKFVIFAFPVPIDIAYKLMAALWFRSMTVVAFETLIVIFIFIVK